MLKKLLIISAFGLCGIIGAQECPDLLSPSNGATNVPVNATISWESVAGIPGYRIRIGTTPGGAEILEQSVGNSTSYTPPLGLPENRQLYVTIILDFLFQGSTDIVCPSQTFTTEDVTTPPGCTTIRNPQDGATNVSVFTNISWFYAPTATGYLLSIGTTPGGGDVLPQTDTGNILAFTPPGQLPENTTLYSTVTPYNENGPAGSCSSTEFTTGELAALPGCTNLTNPINGAINVPLTPFLEWNSVPGATGYRVTIGSAPDRADVLDNATFFTNSTLVLNFEPNRTFFATIVPFNESGEAIGCRQENFSTLLGCGPYLDLATGEFVTLNPEIDFPESLSFCEGEAPFLISSSDLADGYRWYEVDQFGNETLLSESNSISILENGTYRYEAYNLVSQSGDIIECPSTQIFNVVSSEIATIQRLRARSDGVELQITVEATGNGNYEYAIDNEDGPYQDSNVFENVVPGTHIFYVRDKNGCGVVQKAFIQDLTVEGFPKFFTPNGDNINDFWQFIQPPNSEAIVLQSIRIFDRYGKFLKEISQNSEGWDGNFAGRPLPSGDYWFHAVDETNREIKGHFSLKR
ncbi:T9SS type B sorting domain-containing protein [Flagellimonas meishanensis]|uniref:T9SS type B sorting domain-containing protein n=1 Tax=Flagellimonas meishanensis TaxID=2873264 RepID=UPI001CA7959C|nr:T9SS type B sorting domain-containing protein [[Muricauda] meishanensis]